ncbi:hypothetical protein BZA77DRAFT_350467 [Pyronema omphalodes]|nr:hypothetical protein BZA77DRAFT_350467 [Pyronema omphalodes]
MNNTPRLFNAFMKGAARAFKEEHPFFIYPQNTRAQPIHARFLIQRLGRTAGMYVPIMTMFFGWPFFGKYIITKTGGP